MIHSLYVKFPMSGFCYRLYPKLMFCVFALLFGFSCSASAQVLLQSTTSTVNSGLLDVILSKFTERTGIQVRVVSSGTGQALNNARNGDADIVLVHSKIDEEQFVAQGYGVERIELMYNDFVVVGPVDDPARINQSNSAAEALDKIASKRASFVSRGDNSGTHKKEQELWQLLERDITNMTAESWYIESGTGMGTTLNIAVNKVAYTLTDRGTWINFENKLDHEILFEGDNLMFNPYGLILVNIDRHPHTNVQDSQALIDWLLSEEGQRSIRSYRVDGKQLFFTFGD